MLKSDPAPLIVCEEEGVLGQANNYRNEVSVVMIKACNWAIWRRRRDQAEKIELFLKIVVFNGSLIDRKAKSSGYGRVLCLVAENKQSTTLILAPS